MEFKNITRIDFKNISDGFDILNKKIKKINLDSSFMDLVDHADIIKIDNWTTKNKQKRTILITFNNQSIFPNWTDVNQKVIFEINDFQLDLHTKRIERIWIGEFPYRNKAKEYYEILAAFFDNEFGNKERVYDLMNYPSDLYRIDDDFCIDLTLDDSWSKGQSLRLDIKIIRNKKAAANNAL